MTSAAASPWFLHSLQATLAATGLLALSTRRVGWEATAVVVAVGGAAALFPSSPSPAKRADLRGWTAAVLLGASAFAAVRLQTSTPLLPFSLGAVVAGGVAAVAEEVFFRRFLYGWLSQWGPFAAVAISAVAFAAVHVFVYGPVALPVDLGAGLLFGWQRWATGGWSAPAVTHAFANLAVLG